MQVLVFMILAVAFSFHGCTSQQTAALPDLVKIGYNSTIQATDYEGGTVESILQSPNGTFQLHFGELPGQSSAHSLGIVHTKSSQLVWYTYRNGTLGQYDFLGGSSASLLLTSDGDLSISVNGSEGLYILVWNSGTAGQGVVAMKLGEEGNLMLLNATNGTVWQSFDHPIDTLLSSQRLRQGMRLLGAARNGYPFNGFNTLTLEPHRLVAYVNYFHDEPYWQLPSSSNQSNRLIEYATLINGRLSLFDANDQVVATVGNTSVTGGTLQRLVLSNDGNPRIYEYNNITNAWIQIVQFFNDACKLPDDCGFYGLCIPGQGCGCPPSFNLLATLNGCVPPRALACNSSHGNDFIKVPYASYFAIPVDESLQSLSFEDCKRECTATCSCLGFFYAAHGNSSSRSCFITEQLRTFSTSVYENYTDEYSYDLYVRVQGKPGSRVALIAGLSGGFAALVLGLGLWRFVRMRERIAHAEEEEFLLEALPGLPPRFSYKELKAATKGFRERLGRGAFGSVYEGVLQDGTKVAVKRLEGASQGKKEFHAEVATIGTIRHLNLVRLCGFCLQHQHRLLVYEHMARGSLDRLLFGPSPAPAPPLSWDERLAVAMGVARGLAYLHEDCPDCIIHCDVKPDNVLVAEDGTAKLSDFGLSKLLSRQQPDATGGIQSTLRGTRGYLAPEWILGSVSEKSDVYSYGVMLLELICGRRNFVLHDEDSEKNYLPDWAFYSWENGTLEHMIDAKLLEIVMETDERATLDRMDMVRTLMIALLCIQEDPTSRPSMSRVVRMLEGDVEVPLPLPPSHHSLSITGSSTPLFTPTISAFAAASATKFANLFKRKQPPQQQQQRYDTM